MTAQSQASATWFPFLRARAGARLRLVCLPYAGGSARIFRGWPTKLPEEVEVCAAQLPGRENRLSEQPVADAGILTRALADQLQALPAMPSILFGHSMGALLAFETARELERRGDTPAGLIVSAASAPHIRGQERFGQLSDRELVSKVRQMGGTPDEVLNNPELVQLLLPMIRADFTLCDQYRLSPFDGPPLQVPMLAIGASDDPYVTAADIEAWRMLSDDRFRAVLIQGDHFFIDRRPQDLLLYILQMIRGCLLPGTDSSSNGNPRTLAWTTAY